MGLREALVVFALMFALLYLPVLLFAYTIKDTISLTPESLLPLFLTILLLVKLELPILFQLSIIGLDAMDGDSTE